MREIFQSTKIFDGYSTCFRQWRADGTHCKFLHGYGTYFKVTFAGDLDHRNWVFDFGGMKRAKNKIDGMNPKDYFSYLLDHTVLVAIDDPEMELFCRLQLAGAIQLRVMPKVGCEVMAKHLFDVINEFLRLETEGRVVATRVEFFEHPKNSAIYGEL